MISGRMMIDLQQKMNGVWRLFKKVRESNLTDEEAVKVLEALMDAKDKLSESLETEVK